MSPKMMKRQGGPKECSARPLYSEIIARAKSAGLWGAAANGMHLGFTYHGKKKVELHPDAGFINTHVFLDLIGPREQLEAFFEAIRPLLGEDRFATYSELEHWSTASAQEKDDLQHKAS